MISIWVEVKQEQVMGSDGQIEGSDGNRMEGHVLRLGLYLLANRKQLTGECYD